MALTAKKVYAILKRQISDMEAKLNSPVRYRGTVATADLLPLNPDIGDMYNIESKSIYGEAGMNVAWNGVVWDTMGAPIDMSLYIKSSELADWAKQPQKPDYTAEEVGALPANTKIPSKTSDLQNDSGFLTKIPDNYLSGTDKTLSASGKAADAKATGDKITELSADISNKLNKNQGSENSGKIAGINESGDIVPMFPVSVDYNEETNCLEFGSDQKMELNKGINLDSTLTKTGYAADAGAVGEITNSLKEDLSNKITKFYASSQGETHITDSDNGKIMDMMLYGKSEQKQYSGKNLINSDEYYSEYKQSDGTYKGTANNFSIISVPIGKYIGTQITVSCKVIVPSDTLSIVIQATINGVTTEGNKITSGKSGVITITIVPKTESDTIHITYGSGGGGIIVVSEFQIEKGSEATSYEPYVGGQPSPSPDYPQEIKSVVNPTVKVYGENLYSGSDLIGLTKIYVTDFIPVNLHNGKIYISFDAFSDTSNGKYFIGMQYFDANKEKIGGNARADLVGNNISHINFNFNGENAGNNNETVDFKNVLYVKIEFNIYGATATEITYKNIMVSATDSDFEPYKPIQTVTLPYTLNAIPVESGGNVTIDGQQYIADYVDVERGKVVRNIENLTFNGAKNENWTLWNADKDNLWSFMLRNSIKAFVNESASKCNRFEFEANESIDKTFWLCNPSGNPSLQIKNRIIRKDITAFKSWLSNNPIDVIYPLQIPIEEELTAEHVQAFKELITYYPVTNISVNSEQLDGYTVFNYPISMANGWNYVKKQLNDNRDYIYDMDMQSAEAYVNSEYAVALTELEV
mgnify:CR=1 FL=1